MPLKSRKQSWKSPGWWAQLVSTAWRLCLHPSSIDIRMWRRLGRSWGIERNTFNSRFSEVSSLKSCTGFFFFSATLGSCLNSLFLPTAVCLVMRMWFYLSSCMCFSLCNLVWGISECIQLKRRVTLESANWFHVLFQAEKPQPPQPAGADRLPQACPVLSCSPAGRNR